MDADPVSLVRLADRVAGLEHQVHLLRAGLAIALVAASAFAGLAAQAAPPTVLRGERLVLRGERGHGQAEFAVVGGNRLRITIQDSRWLHPPGQDSVMDMFMGSAGLDLLAAPPELRLTDGEHNPVLRLGPLARLLRQP